MRTRRTVLAGTLGVALGISLTAPESAQASPSGKLYVGDFSPALPSTTCWVFNADGSFQFIEDVLFGEIRGGWFEIFSLWFAFAWEGQPGLLLATGTTSGANLETLSAFGWFIPFPVPISTTASAATSCPVSVAAQQDP